MSISHYSDFLLVAGDVKKDARQALTKFTVNVFDSPAGQGEKGEVVSVPTNLSQRLRWLDSREYARELSNQIEIGEILAGMLLPPNARGLLRESLASLREGEGLRLRLRIADDIAAFPWEMLYIQETRGEKTASGFLALDPRLSIVRDMAMQIPADRSPAAPARRVLVAMASPKPYGNQAGQYPKLDSLPLEQRALRAELDEVAGLLTAYLPEFGDHAVDEVTGASLPALSNALMFVDRTDIFHFSGHGEFATGMGATLGTVQGEGRIILAGEQNQAVPLPADRLGELLRSQGVRLVVLNACQTAQRDPYQVWSSVVASLLKARIPAVAAMQFKVMDDLAAAFSASFYRALLTGFPLDYAMSAGRAAMRLAVAGDPARADERDWAAPVLYLRQGDPVLFETVNDAQAAQQAHQELEKLTIHLEATQHFGDVVYGPKVDVRGGDYVEGNKVIYGDVVHGDKVGGDKITVTGSTGVAIGRDIRQTFQYGAGGADLVSLFADIHHKIDARPEDPGLDKGELHELVRNVQQEAALGQRANPARLERLLKTLSDWAPDILAAVREILP